MALLEKPVENTSWNRVTTWHEGQRGKQGHVTQALSASERTGDLKILLDGHTISWDGENI